MSAAITLADAIAALVGEKRAVGYTRVPQFVDIRAVDGAGFLWRGGAFRR